ncbi:hypothetical protein EC968_004105 [Mortierella alpina]|nr:hypothetical protein EC968_004105 [Mortierella alpina]
MSMSSPQLELAVQAGVQSVPENHASAAGHTTVSSNQGAMDSEGNKDSATLQQQQTPLKPSIFLKKKPTVASIGSRPLLKPFNNKFVDYNNPAKHDPLEPVPLKPSKGTAISIPGSAPTVRSASTTSSTSSLASNATPFTFDNHTPESRAETRTEDRNISHVGNSHTSSDPFTILRIKRKRNEEPLDTLVVQEQLDKLAGKKQKKTEDEAQREIQNAIAGDIALPKPPPAVFRLATTVNKASFKDPTQSMQLRDRITSLAETPRPRSRLSERHQPEFEERVHERRGELAQAKQKEARSARYRVINKNRSGLSSNEKPPQVKSSVEVEAEAALDMFKVYDAVKEDEPKTKKQIADEALESDIMCNFLPMVREYLTISDKVPDPKISLKDQGARSSAASSARGDQSDYDSEDEYVYDIYYRDVNADHQQESKHRGIGSLLWFSDNENNFMNEEDSSDDDYEDSDSNAEDYYQNDYPEDEQESADEYAYELSDTDDDEYVY